MVVVEEEEEDVMDVGKVSKLAAFSNEGVIFRLAVEVVVDEVEGLTNLEELGLTNENRDWGGGEDGVLALGGIVATCFFVSSCFFKRKSHKQLRLSFIMGLITDSTISNIVILDITSSPNGIRDKFFSLLAKANKLCRNATLTPKELMSGPGDDDLNTCDKLFCGSSPTFEGTFFREGDGG